MSARRVAPRVRRVVRWRFVAGAVVAILGATMSVVPAGPALAEGTVPVIVELAPRVVARGGVLVIAGSDLVDGTEIPGVTINGVPAGVVSATPTEVRVTVPAAATSGPVVVRSAAGIAEALVDLAVPVVGFTEAQTLPAVRLDAGVPHESVVATADQVAMLTFPLKTDDRLAVQLSGSTFGASTSAARVRVLNPDGTTLVFATGLGASTLWLDTRAVSADGTYTILVDPQGTAVGKATVIAHRVPADAVVAAEVGGPPVAAVTTVPGQDAWVEFDGAAGASVSIALGATSLSTPATSYVRLFGPDGTALSSRTAITASGTFLDAVELPVDGGYRIHIDGAAGQTGSVDATLHVVPTDSDLVAAVDGTPVLVSATVPGQNPAVTFANPEGSFAVELSASTFGASTSSARVSVVGPDGQQAVAPVGFGTSGTFLDVTSISARGVVTVVVNPAGALLGRVTVRVWSVPKDVAILGHSGTAADVETSIPGQNGAVMVDATQGARLGYYAKTSGHSGAVHLSRLDPVGKVIGGVVGVSATGTFVDPVTLPTAGTHSILVNPIGTSVGAVSVTPYVADDVTRAVDVSGSPSTVGVTTPGSVIRLVRPVEVGDRVSMSLTNSTFGPSGARVSVTGPNGNSLVSARAFSAAGTFVDTLIATAAGDMTVLIDPTAAATGSVDVAAWRVPSDNLYQAEVGDRLTVTTGIPGQNARIGFDATAGQRIAVRLTSSTFSASGGTATMSLHRPDGVAQLNAGFGTSGVFADQVTLATTGRYEILIDPQAATSGEVQLEIVNLDGIISDAELDGDPILASTTSAGQNPRIQFAGARGQRVAVRVVSSSFGTSTSNLRLSILSPDGVVTTPATGVVTGSFIEPRDLLLDGQYTLVVDPQSTAIGAVTLELLAVPADVMVRHTADSTPLTLTTSTAGQNAVALVPGKAGQVVSLQFSDSVFGTGSNPSVTLLAPNGSTVVSAMTVGTNGAFVDARTLPADGDYQLVVDPPSASAGSIRVVIHTIVADLPIDLESGGAPVALRVSTPGHNATAAFTSSSGSRAALRFTGATYASAKVSIVRPDGTVLIALTTLGANLWFEPRDLTLDGTYVVTVDPQGASTGMVNIEYFAVPPDGTALASLDGAQTTVKTSPGQNTSLTFQAAAGARISLLARNSTYSPSAARASLYDPAGALLSGPTTVSSAGLFLEPRTVTATGTYRLLIDPPTDSEGSVDVRVFDVPNDVVLELTDTPLDVDIASPGQNATLSTFLTAGEPSLIRITNPPGSTSIIVKSPAGVVLFTRTINAETTFTIAPTDSGNYTITLNPSLHGTGTLNVARLGKVGPVVMNRPPDEWVPPRIAVTWTAPSAVPLAGYAYLLSGKPTADPGTKITTHEARLTLITDGTRWLHIRAIAQDGSAGPVTHHLIQADWVPPVVTGLSSGTHTSETISGSNEIDLEWDSAPDHSGVVKYELMVVPEDESLDDDSEVVATVTEPRAVLDLPDGRWRIGIVGTDAAGNRGSITDEATFATGIDTSVPAAPLVKGSHAHEAATSNRHLAVNFATVEGEPISRWAVVLDSSPDTVPGGPGRIEARFTATLPVGDSWLHVAAQDALGRWSDPAHLKYTVTTPTYVVDLPAGRHLWATTSIPVSCPSESAHSRLAVVSHRDGPDQTTSVGSLATNGTGCGITWNVAEVTHGARVWPDGEYSLAVIDSAGSEISARVPVVVDIDSSTLERLLADRSVGVLDADTYARYLLFATVNPEELPEQYRVGEQVSPESVDLVSAILAEGELSPELASLLTQTDASPLRAASREGSLVHCGLNIHWLGRTWPCKTMSPNFTVHFDPLVASSANAQRQIAALEQARSVYELYGFRVPGRRTEVYLTPFAKYKSGVSLPELPTIAPNRTTSPTIVMSSAEWAAGDDYLPHHEFFHQVQYQYVNAVRVANPVNSPYWWMEATAEWAAHLVQTETEAKPNSYAAGLGKFLAGSSGEFDQGVVNTAGGPEYGAFIMAEFLDEKYGGVAAIERSWREISRWGVGTSPADAWKRVVEGAGGDYPRAIHEFRVAAYALGWDKDAGVGFKSSDAAEDGLWRSFSGLGAFGRPPVASVAFSQSMATRVGEMQLAAGGAGYVEIGQPSGMSGELVISIDGSDSIYADALGVTESYPDLCGGPISVAKGPGRTSATVRVSRECPVATLVITDVREIPLPTVIGGEQEPDLVKWTIAWKPTGSSVSNGTVDIGVNALGTLINESLGLRRTGKDYTEVLARGRMGAYLREGWGVDDGIDSGAVSEFGIGHGVELESYTAAGRTATSIARVGDLRVTHDFAPTASPDLYAARVTVERVGAISPGKVMYRRVIDFDVAPTAFNEYITWGKRQSGDDSRVVALTNNGFAYPNPAHSATDQGSVGYVERFGPMDQGGLIDLDIGEVVPGEPVSFTLFYGVSIGRSRAMDALDVVGADVYMLGEPGAWTPPSSPGEAPDYEFAQNTAVFAFRADGLGERSRENRRSSRFRPDDAIAGLVPEQASREMR